MKVVTSNNNNYEVAENAYCLDDLPAPPKCQPSTNNQASDTSKISMIRKQIPLVKQTLLDTINRERKYECLYKEASYERAIIQAYYSTLEVQLADLENRIHHANPATPTKSSKPTKERVLSITQEKEVMETILGSLTPDQLKSVLAQINK